MNNVIQTTKKLVLQGADYISAGVKWFSEVLQANPMITTIVIGIVGLIAVYLILKELWDIATGSNKSALQSEVKLLKEYVEGLEKKLKNLESDYDALEFHTNVLEEQNQKLKSFAFDKLIPTEIWDKIFEKKIVDIGDITPKEASEIVNDFTKMGDVSISH